ncbi:DUF2536 family protein [Bacillus marinisedimentorum]|uniref:DUF2536 family protein n=1 Tax=Bacillus marinisedimentorum TaxID=1821260 RepID=UPI000872C9BB|nr:DUF2536 family protein [Bacillus marinisedimentorum]
MKLDLTPLSDKVEFFEAPSISALEKAVNEKIEDNKAILLEVHSVSHHVSFHPEIGRPIYSAAVHFKSKN